MRYLAPLLLLVSASACSGEPAGPPVRGSAVIAQLEGPGYALGGTFYDSPLPRSDFDHGLRSGCMTLAFAGSCRAVQCDGPVTPPVGVGTLEASTGGDSLLTATDHPLGPYSVHGDGTLDPGTRVRITATGDSVAAFEGSVTIPEAPDFTLPRSISRHDGFTLTWDPSLAAETVELSLSKSSPAGYVRVLCGTSAARGTMTVPGAVLAHLPTGMATMLAGSRNTVMASAGPDEVEVVGSQSLLALPTLE